MLFKRSSSITAATAVAALIGLGGSMPAAADAATHCVGSPAACPADAAGHHADLQLALNAAKAAPGHDEVVVGAGTFTTAAGFIYSDKQHNGNTVAITGQGDATVLRADAATKPDEFATLHIASSTGTEVSRLRVVAPDVVNGASQTYGVRTEGWIRLEELRVDDENANGLYGTTGVLLKSGGALVRSTVRMSKVADGVIVDQGEAELTDLAVRGLRGIAGTGDVTLVVRRASIEAQTIGAEVVDGTMAIESSLIRAVGHKASALAASAYDVDTATAIKASHVTIDGGNFAGTRGVAGWTTKAAVEIGIDNSIIRGFGHGVSREALDPQGTVGITLMRVNYAAANDYSVGNGMIAGAAIMNQPTGFVDPENGDFRLRPASHMVDKAVDGSNVMLDATDLAGNPRTVGPKRDLGAYEYQASAPGAVITGAGDVQAFRTLALSGSGSKDADPGDEVVAWSWAFGDGTTAQGRDVSHAWSAPGTYEVALTVTDTTGRTGTATTTVVVAPEQQVEGPGWEPRDPVADRLAPAISGLRRSGRSVSLSLDEAATLTVRLERKAKRRFRPVGAGRVFTVAAGPSTLRNAIRKVRPGRYRVTVVATDAAGNRSQARLAFRRR